MRKIKYLFALLLVLFTITSVQASTNLKERNESNKYGVNKKWDMTSERIEYAKQTPYVDASEKIYDFSDILTDAEEKELYDIIVPMIEKYKMDIVIVTYNLPYTRDSQNSEFASDFYDFNDFGLQYEKYDGVVLFRNTYSADPYFDMFSFGDAQLKFYDTRMSNILDHIYPDLKNHNYLTGFKKWLRDIDRYYDEGDLDGYYVDDMGYLQKEKFVYKPLQFITGTGILSAIITFIFIFVNVRKNKMVRLATKAAEYLDKSSFKLLESNDRLVHSHVTSYTESSSSSGGGGGHSSFGGHSGGGFSSGGGRHG